MLRLFECRACGMVATQRHDRCPACRNRGGNSVNEGKAFRAIDAAEFMRLLQD